MPEPSEDRVPVPAGRGATGPFVSVARLLDDARQRLIEARDRDEQPQYLLVHPHVYDVVAAEKAREIAAGRPLRLLGLLLVKSNSNDFDEVTVS